MFITKQPTFKLHPHPAEITSHTKYYDACIFTHCGHHIFLTMDDVLREMVQWNTRCAHYCMWNDRFSWWKCHFPPSINTSVQPVLCAEQPVVDELHCLVYESLHTEPINSILSLNFELQQDMKMSIPHIERCISLRRLWWLHCLKRIHVLFPALPFMKCRMSPLTRIWKPEVWVQP